MSPELRLGDWRDVLADVECDALICDPPYGARTHAGHDAAVENTNETGFDNAQRNALSYGAWDRNDVLRFVKHWSPRTRGWFCAMSCSGLAGEWAAALEGYGRYVFAPVPCVISGMTVRMAGDGPSSWAVWLTVARPRTKAAASWGTLPGAYWGKRSSGQHIGGKPMWLMSAIVRDYSRKGDLVCDPCAGYGTTLQAAVGLGRRAIGAEIDPDTHAKAMRRLERGQMEMVL